jgi:hypothetical protein
VVLHLAPDAAFCFDRESGFDVAENEAEPAAEGRVPEIRDIPLSVVDRDLNATGPSFPRPAIPAPAAAPRAA